MQVSVETTSDIGRAMTVNIPEETIQQAVQKRMSRLKNSVKVDGFRPGKVPQSVMKKKYGGQVRAEVLGDLIQSTFGEAAENEALNVVGYPKFDTKKAVEGEGFEYVATFDVFPVVGLDVISEMTVLNPVCEMSDANLDSMVLRLRDERKAWVVVDRPAEQGDQVTISFEGKVGDESVTGGRVEGHRAILGPDSILPGFNQQLIGHPAGAQLNFEITLPEQEGNKFSGLTAQFDVELSQVEEGQLPELDEAFVKTFGIEDGSVEAFLDDLRSVTEQRLQEALRTRLKNSVTDALYQTIQLSLPEVMVEQEVDQLQASMKQMITSRGGAAPADLPRDRFKQQAEKRVALALIMQAITKQQKLEVEPARLERTLEGLALSHHNPEELIEAYRSNEQRMNDLENFVLEEQTVEWVLANSNKTDELVAFDHLMALSEAA